jgi:hypothetical protein
MIIYSIAFEYCLGYKRSTLSFPGLLAGICVQLNVSPAVFLATFRCVV